MDWEPPLHNVPVIGAVLYSFSMNWIMTALKAILDFKKGARGWKGILRLIAAGFELPYGIVAVAMVWGGIPAATVGVFAEMAGLDRDACLVLAGIPFLIGVVIAARVVVNYCRLLSKQPIDVKNLTITSPVDTGKSPASRLVSTSPVDGQGIQTLTPELNWSAHPEAIDYSLQVATDARFKTLLIDEKRIVDNHYHVPTKTLRSNTEYFWRVDARTNQTTIRLFSRRFRT